MDPKYVDLELDIVEKHGGGRHWQEMAKNPATPGGNVLPAFPRGVPRHVIDHRAKKTGEHVGAERTQVLRRERE